MNRNGETNRNSKGERFAVLEYRSALDVDVIFEDDNSIKNVTYAQVKSGHVRKGDKEDKNSWIGEVVEDRNGEECKIVEYITDDNISVQYRDGDIISGLSFNALVYGNFGKNETIEYSDQNSGIEAERKRTYENLIYLVNRFRRGVMIRPCGFGKTKIGLKLFYSPRYKKCLFLHPASDDTNSNIIKNSNSKKKIDTKTYAWLRGRTEDQIKKLDYDVVFCDEVHCIGGTDDGDGAYHTFKAMKLFMETHPKTHFIGATATPLRMDGINVISTMFHNHVCYGYTDEDAFADGILKKPYYYYCIYDVEKKIRDEINKSTKLSTDKNIEINREDFQRMFKLSEKEVDEIDSRFMDKHIRTSCDKVIKNTKYMRFIAFYLTNEEIEKNKKKVIEWFQNAYPTYEIGHIIVTNRTGVSLKKVDNLPTEPTDPKYEGRIDIIFNCEKLCMGYHSEYITGLILDRKTQSLAKYMQMIGRLLSCDNDNPVIIFDIVDNIHSDFICKMSNIIDVDPVSPVFSDTPKTFNDVLAVYPKARHWDEIKRNNQKARKSEKLLIDNAVLSGEPIIYEEIVDSSMRPIYKTSLTDNITSDAKQEINEAWEAAHKSDHVSFVDAINRISGIKDNSDRSEITMTFDDFCKNNPVINTCTPEHTQMVEDKPYGGKYNQISEQNKCINSIQEHEYTTNTEKETEDPLGYSTGYYYDYVNKDLYSKNVNVLNKRSNFEEDITAIIQKINTDMYNKIIAKWHTYPGCNECYTEYNEIDKKSTKYKLLKSCSEFLFSIPVEKILLFMIEGKAA